MRDNIYNTLKQRKAHLLHITFEEICTFAGVDIEDEDQKMDAWKALNELSEMGIIKSYALDDGAMRVFLIGR